MLVEILVIASRLFLCLPDYDDKENPRQGTIKYLPINVSVNTFFSNFIILRYLPGAYSGFTEPFECNFTSEYGMVRIHYSPQFT